MDDSAGANESLPLETEAQGKIAFKVAYPAEAAAVTSAIQEVSGYDQRATNGTEDENREYLASSPERAERPSFGWAADLAACKQCAFDSDNADKAVKDKAHALLLSVYAFHRKHMQERKDLTAFCKQHESLFAYDKKFEKNPFTPLFKAIHPTAVKQVTSIRSRALLYALRQRVKHTDLVEFLSTNGGIEGCAKKASTAKARSDVEKDRPHESGDASSTDAESLSKSSTDPLSGILIEGMVPPERTASMRSRSK